MAAQVRTGGVRPPGVEERGLRMYAPRRGGARKCGVRKNGVRTLPWVQKIPRGGADVRSGEGRRPLQPTHDGRSASVTSECEWSQC